MFSISIAFSWLNFDKHTIAQFIVAKKCASTLMIIAIIFYMLMVFILSS